MRIFWKECKKILDVRILLILTVFTFFTIRLLCRLHPIRVGDSAQILNTISPFVGNW